MLKRRAMIIGGLALPALVRPGGAQTMPALRLGVLTDLSGQYRDNSGPTSVLAAKQAVEDFAPEKHGFQVEILAADHQQKPDIGAAVARSWFDRENVDAVADVNNTAIALAVRSLVIERDKTLLISGAASADLTGKWCNPNSVHWAPDTYGNAHSTGNAVLKQGKRKWFLIVADYVFGHTLEAEVRTVVKEGGGELLGSVRYPFPGTTDFAAFLLQAQASGADVVAMCSTGGDMENAVKQAHEFGLGSNSTIAAMFGFITEVHAMGLPVAQGLYLTEPFYWDANERTRAFTQRFVPKTNGNYPSSLHAGCYSATLHWMKTAAANGPETMRSGKQAIAGMKAIPTDDDCFGKASIREDGRFLADLRLLQAKTPEQSRSAWDVFSVIATTPGAEAYRPLSAHACPMVRG